ncbi:MFS general substrate transporter [Suhomyces tanzawaensis NRRL Y-17324]|uniref:MFS general substrate transporter n=1 Tax=Suhomyces tanzawaensis NRRL Y-17324 TaxID=984487 RepID=A0A1E4SKI2_9ASCO|nr:MFS general substrate transporter [Suhomyces tanzawaensis NRRL Y-17324]ODV79947.1 MFS general substrate transporter [Suhomyces tanzawaensis NRRL Y-17324]
MVLFGASKEEEDQLRAAANVQQQPGVEHRQSYSSANISAYETADDMVSEPEEYPNPEHRTSTGPQHASDHPHDAELDDATINGGAPSSKYKDAANSADSSVHEDPEPYNVDSDMDENALNRRYTLERISSRRTVEDVAAEDLLKTISGHNTHASTPENEKSIDLAALDWDDPSDPANPQNWAPWKKWAITFTVALVCLTCSLGSSLYVSGTPQLMLRFGASQELVISGLTFYILGLALGPLMTSPLSEIIGRRWIYVFSLPIGMLFTMGIGLSKNIHTILVLRFFAGYFCSPALSVAGGTVSDLWANSPSDMSFAIALFCLAPFLGPVVGPIIGNFAAEHKGWKWAAAWVPLMFSGAILPFIAAAPETYKPTILSSRAAKRGQTINRPPMTGKAIKEMAKYVLLRPLEMLILEPIVLVMSVYIAFVFAVLFGFFEAFPIIFNGVYHMKQGVSGLPFIGVGLGLVSGVFFYVLMDKFYYFKKNPDGTRGNFDENGNMIWDPPEKKLLIGKIGAVCLPISLFWLGWTGRKEVHWMSATASGFPFGFGLILVFLSVLLYFSMAFPPKSVASAIAANNLLRYIMASVFPLFTVQMYHKLHIDWASSLFGFIALAMVPVPFVFEKFGPRFRARSRFGYAAYFKQLAAEKAQKEAAAAGSAPEADSDDTNEKPEEVVSNSV